MAAIAGRAAGRHLRRSLRARAARGDRGSWVYGVLKCSWGDIAALVQALAGKKPLAALGFVFPLWETSAEQRHRSTSEQSEHALTGSSSEMAAPVRALADRMPLAASGIPLEETSAEQ